jgi:hypothetical protein
MSEKRARYVGHPDGIEGLEVPLANGETRRISVPYGGEVPMEIDGQAVPASFRDNLLTQGANWTEVKRATGDEASGARKSAAAEKDGEE